MSCTEKRQKPLTPPPVARYVISENCGSWFNWAADQISFREGRVVQTNYPSYPVTRMRAAPHVVDVHLVESEALPGGIGEPSTAVAAGALVNAIAAATGKRIYKLPIRAEQLRGTATARA